MQKLLTHLLLTTALLATRVAPFCHAHESGEEPVGHDSRPHVHVHSHEHAHGHHAPHDHQDEQWAADSGKSHPGESASQHDDDAIYLVESLATPATVRACSEADDVSAILANLVDQLSSIVLPPPIAVAAPPPDPRIFGPPLFLRQLSLRI